MTLRALAPRCCRGTSAPAYGSSGLPLASALASIVTCWITFGSRFPTAAAARMYRMARRSNGPTSPTRYGTAGWARANSQFTIWKISAISGYRCGPASAADDLIQPHKSASRRPGAALIAGPSLAPIFLNRQPLGFSHVPHLCGDLWQRQRTTGLTRSDSVFIEFGRSAKLVASGARCQAPDHPIPPRASTMAGATGGSIRLFAPGDPNWVKVKNPKAPAVKREAEEDWWSAVHLQMAGSVYCVSPNCWPTWPRVNIQAASLVN
jgi:hypothetical protein